MQVVGGVGARWCEAPTGTVRYMYTYLVPYAIYMPYAGVFILVDPAHLQACLLTTKIVILVAKSGSPVGIAVGSRQ